MNTFHANNNSFNRALYHRSHYSNKEDVDILNFALQCKLNSTEFHVNNCKLNKNNTSKKIHLTFQTFTLTNKSNLYQNKNESAKNTFEFEIQSNTQRNSNNNRPINVEFNLRKNSELQEF